MALGFGFNKAKVLATAEKFVQQGKLQNAIAEYEKITKEDPKDLTVLNTIGDLYVRTGQNEQAAYYFRKVGDQYAHNGFTVKAIAIHKKLTNLLPGNLENTNKLAELYGQQGLLKDARTQYMQVADQLLKSGDNAQAARVFQRILELDPESTATQSKLADLYLKLGKKNEARNIFYTAAETLYARGSHDSAEEALGKVLALDPANASALMLRGIIASDMGDSLAAVQFLGQVPDLDSRPDGLRALLHSKLQAGTLEGVEGLANKLLTLHNDLSGISGLAEWYIANHHILNALKLYEKNIDRFLAAGHGFQESLYPLIGPVKENPEALSILMRLMQASGDTTHNAEVIELQAHACAQKGDLRQARDLYLRLSELEPDNALHSQNYKQMLTRLGEDPTTRPLKPEEAEQAFMMEELDEGATLVHQKYDPPTEKAIEAALTDAELYVSYNVPAKAIPPLEAVLPLAPHDVALNQRLAVLYSRGERYSDAARVCQVLSDVYRELGHTQDAARYLEAAKKYSRRAPTTAPPIRYAAPPPVPEVVPEPLPVAPPQEYFPETASSVQEFSFDVPDHLLLEPEPSPAPVMEMSVAVQPVLDPGEDKDEHTDVHKDAAIADVQLDRDSEAASEWESLLDVEQAPPPSRAEIRAVAPHSQAPPSIQAAAADPAAEKIQEIEFYIAQEMWDAAKKAILDLTEIAPDAPEVTRFISVVSQGQSRAAVAAPPVPVFDLPAPPSSPDPEPVLIRPGPAAPPREEFELQIEDKLTPAAEPINEFALEEIPAKPVSPPRPPQVVTKPSAPPPPRRVADKPTAQPQPAQAAARPATPPPQATVKPISPLPPPQAAARPAPPRAQAPAEEAPLGDIRDILPELSPPASQSSAPTKPRKAAAANDKSTEDILSDFVHDMENTELVDFVPRSKPEPAPPAKSAVSALVPPPAKRVNGDMQDAESAHVLSDILSELQEENADAPEAGEDPETHYNLGIAFKEMGLLDEAIGELQKVCHAMDQGSNFSQPIQAYTWLAQCLVDKGVPQAGVRWYRRALQLPGLDDGSRCAIYYDLALAYEAFGDKKSALANFMEVYGSNIDFRDVASRIKALKS